MPSCGRIRASLPQPAPHFRRQADLAAPRMLGLFALKTNLKLHDMDLFSRRQALRASTGYAFASQMSILSNAALATPKRPDASFMATTNTWISVSDARFGGGAVGDGLADDTAAITAAAAMAAALGRPLYMTGRFAVANLQLPGLGSNLNIIGDPIFVQGQPNTPCLAIRATPLQQAVGCRLSCTVVPHPSSSKADPANIAINLTGFSSSDIHVRLGEASSHTATTGRFHTVVYADSGSPFHYGNRIRLILNTVPAPRFGFRYGNRKRGVAANPNINTLSGWFTNLDTLPGDILIDVGDTTQTIVEGPTLIEACPNAIGIKAGNFTTIRDVWFEQIGVDLDFTATNDTTPNNCRIERCHFSGSHHLVTIAGDLGAPPTFEECLGDAAITFRDQHGSSIQPALISRSRAQPGAPAISFPQGRAAIVPDQNSLRHAIDHHGRTTYQLRYIATPTAIGPATLRLTAPAGYEIEQASIGVRDARGIALSWGLGDDLTGRDYDWHWANVSQHALNIRVTIRATGR